MEKWGWDGLKRLTMGTGEILGFGMLYIGVGNGFKGLGKSLGVKKG